MLTLSKPKIAFVSESPMERLKNTKKQSLGLLKMDPKEINALLLLCGELLSALRSIFLVTREYK